MFTSLTPYLRYPDAEAALQWLERVLGFGPYQVVRDTEGAVTESTIEVGPARVDVNGSAGPGAAGSGALLIVGVADVDAQYERMVAAGATPAPPRDEPYGPRVCNITDPWGYQWYFWQGDAIYPPT
jgi:uncharacterized glyoxalase superfamily protein PhnB